MQVTHLIALAAILVIIELTSCQAQNISGIKGHSIKHQTEWYIMRDYKDYSSNPIKERLSLFDKSGTLIKDTYFNIDGSVERMYAKEKMYYDNWTDTVSLTTTKEVDMGYYVAGYFVQDTLRPKDLSKYDDRGNRILWVWENKVFTYIYDENNNVIEFTSMHINGRIGRQINKYDEHNNLIHKTKTDSRDNSIEYHEYVYNNFGLLEKIIKKDEEDIPFEIRSVTYHFYSN